jgi:hypothetical protein
MNDETQADLRVGAQRRLRHDWEAEKKGMSLRVYCGSHGLHLNRLYAERLHSVANAGLPVMHAAVPTAAARPTPTSARKDHASSTCRASTSRHGSLPNRLGRRSSQPG